MQVEVPVAPDRSLAQRLEALQHANAVRAARKGLKRQLKRGEVSPVDVLRAPAPEFESMKVLDLLLAIPKVGRVKATKWLSASRISPSKTLAGLTQRQRDELIKRMWYSLAYHDASGHGLQLAMTRGRG